MKKCLTEIMKEVKELNLKKSSLLRNEEINSTTKFLKNEEKTKSNYNYSLVTKEIDSIDQRILYLKGELDKANTSIIVPEFDLTISSCLTFLALLQAKKSRYEFLSEKEKFRRIGVTHDGQVEYEEANFDTEEVRQVYEEISLKINKLQMAIDRINLTTLIDIN